MAEVASASDYLVFGMQMPSRIITASTAYRYGFNGQEHSDDVTQGNYTAEFWEYDSRIGRRWNLDPKPNVGISSYSSFGNNPIFNSDPLGDTTVNSAGGNSTVNIDEKQNSLEFYNSSNYRISGTNSNVPVKAGQLRSFTNAVGTFSARWSTDANGNATFAGYKNDKGQTLDVAVNQIISSWKFKLFTWGNALYKEHEKDPLTSNLQITTTLLSMSAMAAVEPVGYSMGYNPSVTTQESMSALGTLNSITREEYTLFNAPYAGRIYGRMISGGGAHNFPTSFDNIILKYGTKIELSNSYTVYRLPGNMANGLMRGITEKAKNPVIDGFYEIGIENGEITHRTFTDKDLLLKNKK